MPYEKPELFLDHNYNNKHGNVIKSRIMRLNNDEYRVVLGITSVGFRDSTEMAVDGEKSDGFCSIFKINLIRLTKTTKKRKQRKDPNE